jgi:hypothetical protein
MEGITFGYNSGIAQWSDPSPRWKFLLEVKRNTENAWD